jgi:hypothetical protein
MRKNLFLSAIFLIFGLSTLTAPAQTAIKPTLIRGDVVSISAEKIVLKAATGEVEASLSEQTKYLRVPPDNLSMAAATPSTFSEIGVGDKVVISVIMPEDKKTIPVRTVYLLSKAALAERQAKYEQDWKTRSTIGRVDNFNPQTNVITILTRSMGVEKTIAVKTNSNTEFLRYAPNSVEFGKALKGKISDVDKDDQIRVLGNKNADGTEIEAEKIISGSFIQSSGKIKAINIDKNEVIITETNSNKDVAITIGEFSILKQFPEELANQIAMRQGGGPVGFRPPTQGGGQSTPQPTPQPQGQTPNGGGFRPGGGGGVIDDSRFQNVKLTDLKVGETIGIMSNKNPDPTRITAIKLFTGVEPFVKRAQMATGGQGGGNRGGGASLSIPGLDGFGGN